jgi:hypothetical protein
LDGAQSPIEFGKNKNGEFGEQTIYMPNSPIISHYNCIGCGKIKHNDGGTTSQPGY